MDNKGKTSYSLMAGFVFLFKITNEDYKLGAREDYRDTGNPRRRTLIPSRE